MDLFYFERKKKAIEALKKAETTYKEIGSLAHHTSIELYSLRKRCSVAINNVEKYLALLANSPQKHKKEVDSVQVSIKDFNEAVKIEKEYSSRQSNEASFSGAGLMGGSAIATLGPTVAMTIATTFGTASTGTAIASLTGAAETNEAWAWLGVGEMAIGVGGMAAGEMAIGVGGMAAGEAFLALGGPVVWIISGATWCVGGGILAIIKNKKAAEKAEQALYKVKPMIDDLKRKLQELRNLYTETDKLLPAINIDTVCKGFPKNYNEFTDDQKLRLGALINSTKAMGVLINKRIS